MTSHEAGCILNAGDEAAHVEILLFYEQRAVNNFEDPEPIAADTPFSSVITSDVPIVVQHTRLDSVMDPKSWTENWPLLRWWAAWKMKERLCRELVRITRPA